MNSPIFTRVKIFTNFFAAAALVGAFSLATFAYAEGWKFDFSRRVKDPSPKELSEGSAEAGPTGNGGFFSNLFDSSEPLQEMVILHTDRGFVPATIRVRQGGNYRLHVVNVNEREKNVSFVLDAFSEHHATYFGKIKTFDIHPKRNGVFRFVSPETSAQGRLVVYPAADQPAADSPSARQPAAEGE